MARPKKRIVPQMVLTLDFGGSGLKGIYQKLNENPEVLFMEPEVFPATLESLQEKTTNNLGNAYPENLAWVGVDDDYRAVGYLAASRYNAMPSLKPKKYALAVYRTLAAIWVAQQRLQLPSCFGIALAALLPPGEFEDSQLLLDGLKQALGCFDTPTGKLKVKLCDFECYPEGGGVYLMHCFSSPEAIKRKVCAVVMVGYRNASVLLSMRGMVSKGKSIDLGMVRLVELVMEKTSGMRAELLVKAIAAAPTTPQAKHFLPLTESNVSLDLRRAEAEKILAALLDSRGEYLTALKAWLTEVLPRELDEVVFCGGTADYFREELDSYFPATPVKWHGGFSFPPHFQEEWLGNRLADAYGLSIVFTENIVKQYLMGKQEVGAHG